MLTSVVVAPAAVVNVTEIVLGGPAAVGTRWKSMAAPHVHRQVVAPCTRRAGAKTHRFDAVVVEQVGCGRAASGDGGDDYLVGAVAEGVDRLRHRRGGARAEQVSELGDLGDADPRA